MVRGSEVRARRLRRVIPAEVVLKDLERLGDDYLVLTRHVQLPELA